MLRRLLFILLFATTVFATTEDNYAPIEYDCDGSTTEFTFSWPIGATSDIEVILKLTSTEAETVLTETTHYDVSATNNDYSSGGTVTTITTYADTYTLTIRRETAKSQDAILEDTRVLRLAVLEEGYDKLTRLVQDVQEILSRCLKIPKTETSNVGLVSISNRADKNITFDSTTGDVSVTSVLSTGSASISAWGETLIDDGDAEEARGTLELDTDDDVEFAAITGTTGTFTDIITKGPWIDVRAYGAVGNGVADDTTAIQAAIDAANSAGGGIVFFPIGTYKVSSTLFLKPRVSLIGANAHGCTIDYTGTGHVFSAENNQVAYFTIQDLTIDGNSNTGDLINITNADSSYNTYIILKNLRLSSAGENAIRFSHVLLSQIENCNIWYCGNNGIYLDTQPYSMTSISISDTWIHNLDNGHGIYVAGAEAIHSLNLNAVYTELIVGDGIHIATPLTVSSISIDGFVAEAITGNGIKATTSYMTVEHALFVTISGDGINIESGSLTATNCRFAGVDGDDFDTGSAYVTILGCEPQDNLVFDAGTGSTRPVFHDWNTYAVTGKTSDYTILKSDHLRTFTNEGAGGSVNFTLPTIEANLIGFQITIDYVTTSKIISITPEASDFIYPQRLGSGVAIYNISARIGDSITLAAVNSSQWIVTSQVGIWGKAPGTQGDLPSFADVNATPVVSSSDVWLTGTATETITDFDFGYTGQVLTVISKAAVTFDTTTAQDADHNLDGSSVDIVTATGDVTQWICEDGTTWRLIGFVDASADNSSGA